jgi:site-specific DNA-methyltransferase (adenine-specific)
MESKKAVIHCGYVRKVLSKMKAECFDACFCDPPYGLDFMSKNWDHGVPSTRVWKGVYRVLKPGSFLLAFGGTRTFHRLACNIEDAGFEIRDCCMWVYGSGFPKSQDISKAIDKVAGASRKVIGVKPGHGEFANRTTKGHIDFKDGTEGFDRPWMHNDESRKQYHLATAPATPEAEKWDGWGTALKPAWEPIIVARKPVVGTVAQNVLKYGTGGINIDGCRIELNGDYKSKANGRPSQTGLGDNYDSSKANKPDTVGRWPANILHDGSDDVVKLFPESKGQLFNVKGTESSRIGGDKTNCYSGGAARFFYCAKASKSERDAGLNGFPLKSSSKMGAGIRSSVGLKREGTTSSEDRVSKNHHPTVKPLSLNKYLAKLILLPDGRKRKLLVPFSGSGSEMIGALKAGWDRVCGIEKETDYVDIAEKRLRHWNKCDVDVYDWE